MLLRYFGRPDFVTLFIIVGVVMIFAFIFHNVFQTWIASRYGDASPKFSGYGKFDPQQQLEPFGVLFLALLGFGWPKQIPVNSRNYSGRGRQEAVVWYSGPLAYLIVAFVSAFIGVGLFLLGSPGLEFAFREASSVAILHAVINLFPVYPLDGAKAALAWGNADVRRLVQQIASLGILGFIIVFFVLQAIGVTGALQGLFSSIITSIIRLLVGG